MALLAVCLLMGAPGTRAQEKRSTTMERSFEMGQDGELQLENKYGNVLFKGWELAKVSVKVTVRVEEGKRESAQELLSRIEPVFTATGGLLSIKTEIRNKKKGWLADFFNSTLPLGGDNGNIQIDYEISLPKGADLRVDNKFGDVAIEDWNGDLKAKIGHGNLWLGNDLEKADIQMAFGRVRAKDLGRGNIELDNGELRMENAEVLRLASNGAEISINNVNRLEVQSNKDELEINEVGDFMGDLKFSVVNLRRLTRDLDLALKIVDLQILEIANPASKIYFDQEASDIDLWVTDFSHRFHASLEEGVVRLPKSFAEVKSNLLDKSRKLREIDAAFGKERTGLISIKGQRGIVTLHE